MRTENNNKDTIKEWKKGWEQREKECENKTEGRDKRKKGSIKGL